LGDRGWIFWHKDPRVLPDLADPLIRNCLFYGGAGIVNHLLHPEPASSVPVSTLSSHFHLTSPGPIGWFIFVAGFLQSAAALIALTLPELDFSESSVYGAGHYMHVTSSRFRTGVKKNLLASLHLAFGSITLALLVAGTQFSVEVPTIHSGDALTINVTEEVPVGPEWADYKTANRCIVDGDGFCACAVVLKSQNPVNPTGPERRAIKVRVAGMPEGQALGLVKEALESGISPIVVKDVSLTLELHSN
jgi:hypothetical protein